jgi:hypothetical protein
MKESTKYIDQGQTSLLSLERRISINKYIKIQQDLTEGKVN